MNILITVLVSIEDATSNLLYTVLGQSVYRVYPYLSVLTTVPPRGA